MKQTFAFRTAVLAGLLPAFPLYAETGVDDDVVRLGMVNVQSGPAAALGTGMLAGAAAVFDKVNAQGGVHGRHIDLLVADEGYEPEQSIDETLVGLFAGAGSLRTSVTPQMPNLRSSYDDEAEALVAHFLDNGARNVAVFYQNDEFGKALLSGTEKALARRHMEVQAKGTFQRNTMAVKSGLANMLEADPDAIILVGTYAPLAEFVRQALAAGLDSQMATVSFVGTENLASAVGKAGNGVLITQIMPHPYDDQVAVVEDCRQLISEHSGESLDYVNLEGCVSAKVMVEGLQAAGRDLTREGLMSAMQSMQKLDLGSIRISYSAEDQRAMNPGR